MSSNAEKLDNVGQNPHASASRWRHQESSAYARYAGSHAQPRDPQEKGTTNDLADFLNRDRVEPDSTVSAENRTGNFKPIMIGAAEADHQVEPLEQGHTDGVKAEGESDGKDIVCGPLLNYRKTKGNVWHGSALLVIRGGGKTQPFTPTMLIRRGLRDDGRIYGEINATNGAPEALTAAEDEGATQVKGECLYSDPRNTFWAFDIAVEMTQDETKWEYWFPDMRMTTPKKPQRNAFYAPSINESMRIMFHSCNGFSVGTDEDEWCGPALWNDVVRRHAQVPFHVMVGGGDQIYNDGIRVDGPLRPWTDISNPKKRKHYPFPEKLRQACDDYYLKNYIQWSVHLTQCMLHAISHALGTPRALSPR